MVQEEKNRLQKGVDEMIKRSQLQTYQANCPVPDDGTMSAQLIVRARYADGHVVEKCIRCWQPGEVAYFGVNPPKRRKPRADI